MLISLKGAPGHKKVSILNCKIIPKHLHFQICVFVTISRGANRRKLSSVTPATQDYFYSAIHTQRAIWGLVTIEMLITFLTIENTNLNIQVRPINREWQWTALAIIAMFVSDQSNMGAEFLPQLCFPFWARNFCVSVNCEKLVVHRCKRPQFSHFSTSLTLSLST